MESVQLHVTSCHTVSYSVPQISIFVVSAGGAAAAGTPTAARPTRCYLLLWYCVYRGQTYKIGKMSKRTALNTPFKGLVETMSIPVELHERDGKKFASFGSAVPIHCCPPEQVAERAIKTHHYCDLFTEQLLAPLGEFAYVRLDENTAEKVFINRSKRILLVSGDGQLALWRSAPSFESSNQFVAGAPIVDQDGALVSLVTVRSGNHYAVSTFEGVGGYFDTPTPWKVLQSAADAVIYGEHTFTDREVLRAHVQALPPAELAQDRPAAPVLHAAATPRVVLLAHNGRQLAHTYVQGVLARDVEYL